MMIMVKSQTVTIHSAIVHHQFET